MSIDLFKDICMYLALLKSTPPPPPIFKALWLCFAVGYLIHRDGYYLSESTNTTFISLASNYEPEAIFTHHPALLHWTCQSQNVTKTFKIKILELWVRKRSQRSDDELKSILTKSRDAFSLYLELLPTLCVDENSTSEHLGILPEALQLADDDFVESVSYDAWSLLPQVLLQSSLRLNFYEMIPLLVFCCEFQPVLVQQDLLLRIACTLPGTISRQLSMPSVGESSVEDNPLKFVVIFKFIRVLMDQVEEKSENMILTTFLNNQRFINTLEYSLAVEHSELSVEVLELLSAFLLFQRKYGKSSCHNLKITGDKLKRWLYGDAPVVRAAVKMLHCLLSDDVIFSSNLLVNVENPQNHVRVLYVRLHMICSMGTEDVAAWCWTCLRRLLIYSFNCSSLQRHLASLPYTHSLISSCVPGSQAWDAMMQFIDTWVGCQPPLSNQRSLSKTMSDKTSVFIAASNLK